MRRTISILTLIFTLALNLTPYPNQIISTRTGPVPDPNFNNPNPDSNLSLTHP